MADDGDFWSSADREPATYETEATTALQDLVERVARLEVQVQGLYTASAAYAQIARGDTEHARAEARSDMERVRTDLTELIDRLVAMVREVSPAGDGSLATGDGPATGVPALSRSGAPWRDDATPLGDALPAEDRPPRDVR